MCLSRYFIDFRVEEQISHTTLASLDMLDLSMLITVTLFSVLKPIAGFISYRNDDDLLVMFITVNTIHLSENPSLDNNFLFKILHLKESLHQTPHAM